jgi:hypothetical protein
LLRLIDFLKFIKTEQCDWTPVSMLYPRHH